ncbi:MAG: formimidoylglutamate deiminase [Bacteroidetes bacterium]|nr:MAG: formimidoylglutamate deiminase [Bacteroidota bacterium]TAG88705.1 MAG: formimidoylglutamate deiminase [Bacteroidota bacterium]
MKILHFKAITLKDSWLENAYIEIDNTGKITKISTEKIETTENIEFIKGYAIPAMVNSHSHAFQYVMNGKAEVHTNHNADDFWSWREAMYQTALSVSPEEVENIATTLYKQMLNVGYGEVVEFHYLHHDKNGKPYAYLPEMSERLLKAAQNAGIKITLVPIFYQKGGFGKPPTEGQKRFISKDFSTYIDLFESVKKIISNYKNASLGVGFHSLRAMEPELLPEFINTFAHQNFPIHLHIAEQLLEVEHCLQYLHARPVEWLLNNAPISDKWNLTHCTHLTDFETEKLAKSKANVILCPSTEGNLGDGIFNLKNFQKYGGKWAIGTDSHIGLNPAEEMRWLDYGQRLRTHNRQSFTSETERESGRFALKNIIETGRKTTGKFTTDFFEIGQSFDALILDVAHPILENHPLQYILSSWLYGLDSRAYLGTMIDGKFVNR